MKRSPLWIWLVSIFAHLLGSATFAGVAGGPCSQQEGVGEPILEHHGPSLTNYLPTGATLVQDVRPTVEQRGTYLDGSPRFKPSFAMAIAGNPFEDVDGAVKRQEVEWNTGTFNVEDVDLALPSTGPVWVIGRTYNVRQEASNGSHRDSNGYQGRNWFQSSQPEILLYEDGADDANDLVYLVYGADRFAEFKRVDIGVGTSETFKGTNGTAGIFFYDPPVGSSPETYTLIDQNGLEFRFFGFDSNAGTAKGQLWKITDAAGNVAYAGDASSPSLAISQGYASGRLAEVFDAEGRRYTYTYSSPDGNVRLTSVVVETLNGAQWTEVARVEYEYFSTSGANGSAGDLKLVIKESKLPGEGLKLRKTKYYRYWTSGNAHAIKYVMGFEGARRFDFDDGVFDQSYLTASDAALEPYCSAHLAYDSDYRISSAWFFGYCACEPGVPDGTTLYRYETSTSFVDAPNAYDTEWKNRTVIERPDGSFVTQYYDETGQSLTRVLTDADPEFGAPAETWVTDVERDAGGCVTEVRLPASVSSYDHTDGEVTLHTSTGLIYGYARVSSGINAGFLETLRWKKGSAGFVTLQDEFGYENIELSLWGTKSLDSAIVRPLVSSETVYSNFTSIPVGGDTTLMSTTAHSGTLAIERIETTLSAVSTSKNGEGMTATREKYYRLNGTPSFEVATDGVISYTEFQEGELSLTIEDADTNLTGPGEDFEGVTIPPGVSSSPGAFHRKTIFTDTPSVGSKTIFADGLIRQESRTKLADDREVLLSYADYKDLTEPGQFFGPVRYTVTNQAGKVELEGLIALNGDSTFELASTHIDEGSSDPILAVTVGSVVRLKTQQYDGVGTRRLGEKVYFQIPTSGEGQLGVHYDEASYGFDEMGRFERIKDISGTITRAVFDRRGHMLERHVGTNDASFPRGDMTGTDDMTAVEEVEYDGGVSGGNGHITKRTLFVEDSGVGKREFTYVTDVKGNPTLEVGPASPTRFLKYDNVGRILATAWFDDGTSIDPDTEDPVSKTDGRVYLREIFYDERGDRWKFARHEIEPADGTSVDQLDELSWYDSRGRHMKNKGPQLVKFRYDRLGRKTHSFLLATDNDTNYAQSLEVDDDIVLEESQSVYETSGDAVTLSVSILRFHDDYGVGETVGPLDSGNDGDPMLVSMQDVSGRPFISAAWFDRFRRLTDFVDAGTNDGVDFDRTGLSVPARSDDYRVWTFDFETDGTVYETTDPKGIVTRTEYDQGGRLATQVKNSLGGVPTTPDLNQTLLMTYEGGQLATLTVDMPSSVSDQVTTYSYGVTKGVASDDSRVSAGHLLASVTYPDSQGSADVVSYAYNAQGQMTYRKDQTGTEMEFGYDDYGRLTERRVAGLGPNVDGQVRRLEFGYESRGLLSRATQFDQPGSGAGQAVNEVQISYDGWGNILRMDHDVDSEVGGAGMAAYPVTLEYESASGGRNSVRRTKMTTPPGKTVRYLYDSNNYDADMSRVSRVRSDNDIVATYEHLGSSNVVGFAYPEPDISCRQYGASQGDYPDFDRFNRSIDSRWTAGTEDFYWNKVARDRNSNVTTVENLVHTDFDVAYSIDSLDRIASAEEGTLSGGVIPSPVRSEDWTLDLMGNWERTRLDLDGDGNFSGAGEHDDTRSYGTANELETRDTDSNPSTPDNNFDLAFEESGELIDDGSDYTYEYDAFGRLRKIRDRDTSDLLSEYTYDGLGNLIGLHEDRNGDEIVDSLDEWIHRVHDTSGRMIVSYVGNDSNPHEVYVHHAAGLDGLGDSFYVNGVICREETREFTIQGVGGGPPLPPVILTVGRTYYCQNWKGDVVALVDDERNLLEWVTYGSYGVPFGFPGADTDSDGDCDSQDLAQIDTWSGSGHYDVRGDINLDGVVDGTDRSVAESTTLGETLGRGALSWTGNRRGWSGYEYTGLDARLLHVRNRVFHTELGGWIRRDPIEYGDSANLYEYCISNPVRHVDPEGLQAEAAATAAFILEPSPVGEAVVLGAAIGAAAMAIPAALGTATMAGTRPPIPLDPVETHNDSNKRHSGSSKSGRHQQNMDRQVRERVRRVKRQGEALPRDWEAPKGWNDDDLWWDRFTKKLRKEGLGHLIPPDQGPQACLAPNIRCMPPTPSSPGAGGRVPGSPGGAPNGPSGPWSRGPGPPSSPPGGPPSPGAAPWIPPTPMSGGRGPSPADIADLLDWLEEQESDVLFTVDGNGGGSIHREIGYSSLIGR